jgi:hypothetical protein
MDRSGSDGRGSQGLIVATETRRAQRKEVIEWSIGVLEYWSIGVMEVFQHSKTPLLQYSRSR